jgi:hypothetical protein
MYYKRLKNKIKNKIFKVEYLKTFIKYIIIAIKINKY